MSIQYNLYDLSQISVSDSDHSGTAAQRVKTALRAAFPEEMKGPSAELLFGVCIGLARFLALKNAAYGDSALKPLRVFSSASPEEQLRVRIDDKLSRLARGSAAGEDSVVDLAGYLVLLLASREVT